MTSINQSKIKKFNESLNSKEIFKDEKISLINDDLSFTLNEEFPNGRKEKSINFKETEEKDKFTFLENSFQQKIEDVKTHFNNEINKIKNETQIHFEKLENETRANTNRIILLEQKFPELMQILNQNNENAKKNLLKEHKIELEHSKTYYIFFQEKNTCSERLDNKESIEVSNKLIKEKVHPSSRSPKVIFNIINEKKKEGELRKRNCSFFNLITENITYNHNKSIKKFFRNESTRDSTNLRKDIKEIDLKLERKKKHTNATFIQNEDSKEKIKEKITPNNSHRLKKTYTFFHEEKLKNSKRENFSPFTQKPDLSKGLQPERNNILKRFSKIEENLNKFSKDNQILLKHIEKKLDRTEFNSKFNQLTPQTKFKQEINKIMEEITNICKIR